MFHQDGEDPNKQISWQLRIVRNLFLAWGMFWAVFLLGSMLTLMLYPPITGIYRSITDGGCLDGPVHSATVDTGDATVLRVVGERGGLSVVGSPGSSVIQINGESCASKQSTKHLASMFLNTSRVGNEIVVTVDMPRLGSSIANDIRMDLEIIIPQDFDRIELDNAEGPVTVSNVHDLQVVIGVGDLDVRAISGSVEVLGLEGSMAMVDIAGDVTIDAIHGYGDVDLFGIGGDVMIENNRSGPARITDVGGDVTIGSAGYGQLNVTDIAGDLFVDENPGGDIFAQEIGGSIQLPDLPDLSEISGISGA